MNLPETRFTSYGFNFVLELQTQNLTCTKICLDDRFIEISWSSI